MFIIIIFVLNVALLAYILIYGICLFSLPFVRSIKDSEKSLEDEVSSAAPVAVLVPSHFEGEGLVSTVKSLINQSYPAQITVYILLADSEDSSFDALRREFSFVWDENARSQKIYHKGDRTVELHLCGFKPKKDKLNYIIPILKQEYTALLDADHRAEPAWISRSVKRLSNSNYIAVQSRRAPLSLSRVAQLWDSAQNHIGNELVNRAMKKVVGSVFFTGTTAVFKTSSLAVQPFGDCVTEDTYLSYELLTKGELIDFEPQTGSREEVAPDIASYIARRRRWSCGHNTTFFGLASRVFAAKLGWRKKLATLVHGLFYTVPVAVAILLNLFALQLFVQYTSRIQILVLCFNAVVAYCAASLLFGRYRNITREVLAAFILLLPKIILLSPVVLYWAEHELFYFLTAFPYSYYLFWSHAFCISAPLILLLLGSRKIKLLSISQLAFIGLSYPLFFILDLYSCLLGFVDFVFGRPTWSKIQRTFEDDAEDQTASASTTRLLARGIAGVFSVIFLLILVNDLTAYSNCGQLRTYAFKPLLFSPKDSIDWEISEKTEVISETRMKKRFSSSIGNEAKQRFEISHFVDGIFIDASSSSERLAKMDFDYEIDLGWSTHDYLAKLKSSDQFCSREVEFTNRSVKLKNNKLYVNAEPFWIKGVIPSFSPRQTSLDTSSGYGQIKALGANTVRLYHSPQTSQLDASAEHELMLVAQPDRSTWDDVNLLLPWSRKLLRRRYKELVEDLSANPLSLLTNLGNELEIRNPRLFVPKLKVLADKVAKEFSENITSYSTFFVFLKLPTMVYGINMLDSGLTYWRDGLDTLKTLKKPFYASEFGGFVAAFESTPPELRAYRLLDYEKTLRDAGSLGIIVHQSHDNWSQAVVDGFNDPFTADQPDDLRGIWSRENKPKLVKRFVEQLFSDVEARFSLESESESIRLELKNKREYTLSRLVLFDEGRRISKPIDLNPKEIITVPIDKVDLSQHTVKLVAKYSTHKGLSMQSVVNVITPATDKKPRILNTDAHKVQSTESMLRARLLKGGKLEMYIPNSWTSFTVNGKRFSRDFEYFVAEVPSSMQEVVSFELTRNDKSWRSFSSDEIRVGEYRLRFKLDKDYPDDALLLLAGLGAREIKIRYGENPDWQKHSTHKYRENLISLGDIRKGEKPGKYIYLHFSRNDTLFISAKDHPEGRRVSIQIESPKVFWPVEVLVENAR